MDGEVRMKSAIGTELLDRSVAKTAEELSFDEIISILTRENELRLSQDTQRKFKEVSNKPDEWLNVVEELQYQVAREFNLPYDTALKVMRDAESLVQLPAFKAEKKGTTAMLQEIKEVCLYRKYNRCVDSLLQVGDVPPNISLVHGGSTHTSFEIVKLHSIMERSSDRTNLDSHRPLPLVIFAGSYT